MHVWLESVRRMLSNALQGLDIEVFKSGYAVTHVREGNHLDSVTEGVQIKLTKDKPREEHHTHMGAPRKLAQDVASTGFTSCLRRGRERGQHFWKSKPCVGEAERAHTGTPERLRTFVPTL